jgi:hypothetical protein
MPIKNSKGEPQRQQIAIKISATVVAKIRKVVPDFRSKRNFIVDT